MSSPEAPGGHAHTQRRRVLRAGGAVALAVGTPALTGMSPARAQADYPARPVRILIGFSAGGPTDAVGRLLAELLTERLKQNFVAENRAGANGGVAAQAIAGVPPDGYSLMLGSSGTLSIAPVLKEKLPYDPLRSFTPVGLVASYPYLLVVPGDSPVSDVPSLVARAKAMPGKLSYASAGVGTVNHLAGEWFRSAAGIVINHVPYKGDSAALGDLTEGRVDLAFLSIVAAMPQIRAGRLKAIGIASQKPFPGLETIATMASFGYPVVAEPWNGIMGPAGLPADVVRKLNEAINEVMQRPETRARLLAIGQVPFTDTPEAFRRHIEQQTARWADVIRSAGIAKEP